MIHQTLETKHRDIIKVAFIGAALGGLKLMGRAGKVIVKNPGRSIGASFGAGDAVSGTRRMNQAVTFGHNIADDVGRITM